MKANRLMLATLLLLCAAAFQLPAQQSEADRRRFEEIKTKAEMGDARWQFYLGISYSDGINGVAKDEVEAFKWMRKAAEQDNDQAQFLLFGYYDQGIGVPESQVEAMKWLRKAAEQNNPLALALLALKYTEGNGVAKDEVEAMKWRCKAYAVRAEQGDASAQYSLGLCYAYGQGVTKDEVEAVKWWRKAAEQGHADAQFDLGVSYANGEGVTKDEAEAVKWYRKAAEQAYASAQLNLGFMYSKGNGVIKDEVEAYKWYLLAGAQGEEFAKKNIGIIERQMAASQRAEGQRLAREWKPRKPTAEGELTTGKEVADSRPSASGSGFFITDDGYFITNQHVAGEGATVRVLTVAGAVSAKVVKVDKGSDLALLKAQGKFAALPVAASRGVKLGNTVVTVGFPNVDLQGFSPKLAKGEVASLAGAQDDARHFQISAPIQPGNSGGALVDERGNVIGVVVAKLSQKAALAASGTLAENVNYAVKSSYLLSFLESVPEVAAKLKEPNMKERKFEDVVKSAEQAAVLVLVY